MLLRTLDFETTGFPPSAGIVEVGWTDVTLSHQPKPGEAYSLEVGDWQSEITDPGMPIEVGAMAKHHLTEEDVKGRRKPGVVLNEILPDVDVFVAHNARFEQEFFKPEGIPWICTYKLALRCCPTAPNHQNQTLRYFLKTPVNKESCFPPHRAGPDSYVTAHTLAKFIKDLIGKLSIETMIKWSSEPPVMPTCPIGKFRGKPWEEVEMGFLAWCLRQPTMEEDIKWNVEREIKRRHA